MSPPFGSRHSRPGTDEPVEDPTGIHSIATKALLQGLVDDVRDMRSEVSGTAGIALRIEQRQTEFAKCILDHEKRIHDVECDLRTYKADEGIWKVKQETVVQAMQTQLGLIGPLTASHEQLLQQAKGAAMTAKLMYAIAGALGVGGVQAIIHIISMMKGH